MFSHASLPPLKTDLPPLKKSRPILRQLPRLDPMGLGRGLEPTSLKSISLAERSPLLAPVRTNENIPEKVESLDRGLDFLMLNNINKSTPATFETPICPKISSPAELCGEKAENKVKPLKPFINLKLDKLLQAPSVDLDEILKNDPQKVIEEQDQDKTPKESKEPEELKDESAENLRRRIHRTFGFESQGRRSCRPPPTIKIPVLPLPTTVSGFKNALRKHRKATPVTEAQKDGRITATMSLSYCTFDDDLLADLI